MRQPDNERSERFEALFAAYRADIVSFCSWRAASASDAQDAVADVFLAAWRRLDELPDGDAARVWLYGTARRVLANQRRSRRRRLALRERLELEAVSARPAAERDQEETLVRDALDRLGARDREVLLLAEWEGLSAQEIAAVTGCLAVTARGRLHRARLRFRALYEELQGGRSTREASAGPTTQVMRRRIHEHV
jgi:RNA polymerase sigma factor (sigma-70 family)